MNARRKTDDLRERAELEAVLDRWIDSNFDEAQTPHTGLLAEAIMAAGWRKV